MSPIYLATALVILGAMLLGAFGIFRQSGLAEGLLAALLAGSTGVALVLVLGRGLSLQGTIDVALVLAFLAVVLGVAFVLQGWPGDPFKEEEEP